jgi:hypothetical protein
MAGLHTLESTSPSLTYQALSPLIDDATDEVLCYSRLPARQLLRHIPSNKANMWWISDHESPQSIAPHTNEFISHIRQHSSHATELIVVEALDWLVARSSETEVLSMLQELDILTRSYDIDLVFPVDALSFTMRFWARLTSLAPKMEGESSTGDDEPWIEDASNPIENDEMWTETETSTEQILVHLVNLPRVGFTHTLLAKRMLQWKRMGFDLSALEPALVISDVSKSHAIYETVESDIVCAIDGIRLLEANRDKLDATEREMFNYRFMAINNVREAAHDLETLLSSR